MIFTFVYYFTLFILTKAFQLQIYLKTSNIPQEEIMFSKRIFPIFLSFIFSILILIPSLSISQERVTSTDPELRLKWYNEHVKMKESSLFKNLSWSFIGPTNTSGRVTDVAVVTPRGKNYTVYAATATGGLWKTVNEGTTWDPVFEHGPSTSIGDVTIAPSNPNTVWIGTGEANIFRSSNAGAGVFKSTDAGKTWKNMGLTDTNTIPRIIVHPKNENIVYVAASGHEWTDNAERGLYKTTDGGETWDKVFYVDDKTGVIDIVMDPKNSNTIYAATWMRIRDKWNDPRTLDEYTDSGIYKSTNGGKSWKRLTEGLPQAKFTGRIGLDISQSNPNTIYAFVDNYEISNIATPVNATDSYGRPRGGTIKGAQVYRSDNKGKSWRLVSQENRYMERLSSTYGWVFGQIRVDPTNPEKIYIMGLGLHVSEDGGKNFKRLRGMHGDHHGLWIDPENPDFLINTNDGGIYFSYDAGANWRDFADKIPAVQFFNIGYDMSTPFKVYGSIQDHGSRRGVVTLARNRQGNKTGYIAVDFSSSPGGEGSTHVIDPGNPDIVYSAGFYGNISRTIMSTRGAGGGRAFLSNSIMPKVPADEPPLRGQWIAPFILSPHNSNVLYHGMQYIFRSRDMGQSWTRISPDLSHNILDKLGDIPHQVLFSISESPLKQGLLYAGTDDGRIHVTQNSNPRRNGSVDWTEITGNLPVQKFVAELVASKYDESTVYAALNGKRDDDFAPYLYVSTNYGRSWRSIVNNIPSGPINVIKEDPHNSNILYVGTDLGVYVSIDKGASWDVLANNLPTTYVHDLIIHPRDNVMVIATHGRGMYAIDVTEIQKHGN